MNYVVRGGEVSRVDGPYAEAKEVVGGWSILQYDSLEAAQADQREIAECMRGSGRRRRSSPPCARSPPARRPPATDRDSLRWQRAGRDQCAGAARCHRRRVAGRVGPPGRALTRMTHDVGLAEDLAQDALVAALEQWPTRGVREAPSRG